MKKSILLFSILFLSSVFCEAQSQFQRTIGGTGEDGAYSIISTTDGGYAAAGYTLSFGPGSDIYIVKLDGSGTLQWTRTVGGTLYEEAYSIIQTTDGGYAAAGGTFSFGAGNRDMYIIKLDGSGALLWSKCIGGTGNDYARSIIQTTDGGYVVAGLTLSFGAGNYDMYIVKLDASGTLQWSRTVGGTNEDGALSIIRTTDGGYAVAGYTNSFGAGSGDMYIVKLDGSGTLQWSKTVGGANDDYARFIIQTTDGGYAATGWTSSFGAGNYDSYIIKLDASGILQWNKTIGGTGDDRATSVIQTTDGIYALAGGTTSFGAGDYDFYIIKLDASGSLLWNKTVGGTSSDLAYSIIRTTDGGYAVAGYTNSFGAGNFDIYIVKLDAGGNTCGNSSSPSSITGTGGTLGSPTSIVTSPTSTVTSPLPTTGTGGILTTICVIGIQPISNEIPGSFELKQNYPNPFNSNTIINFQLPMFSNVKLAVYDVLGREAAMLVNEELKAGTYSVDWDATNFPSGVYFYELEAEDYAATKRMVLIK